MIPTEDIKARISGQCVKCKATVEGYYVARGDPKDTRLYELAQHVAGKLAVHLKEGCDGGGSD
jgi:hypothetical protein